MTAIMLVYSSGNIHSGKDWWLKIKAFKKQAHEYVNDPCIPKVTDPIISV
jgi:hypothetical protein